MAGEKQSAGEETSFEAALAQLEEIVQDLEEGEISLAEALARYESGVQLLRQCYRLLEHAQRRIEVLSRVDSAGNAECESFDEGATSLDSKAQTRSRRRSRQAERPVEDVPDTMDGPGRLF